MPAYKPLPVATTMRHMPDGPFTIRPALVLDARAIAEVHVETWKSAYRGIFSETLLAGLSVETRERYWRDSLAAPEPSAAITLVGCDPAGAVVAFVSGGKERTGQLGCDAELCAIYLRPEAQRKELGTSLVRRFVEDLHLRGFASLAVWVLALKPAKRFYERLGGTVIGQRQIERGGQTFIEVAYGWMSLSMFR